MKTRKLVSILSAGLFAFTIFGTITAAKSGDTQTGIIAHAADTQFDLSNKEAGQWTLAYYGPTPDYSNYDPDFYTELNSLTAPTKVPVSTVSNMDLTPGQSFNVSTVQVSPNNIDIVGYEQYYSDAYKTEAIEYNPKGQIVDNPSLKIKPAPDNPNADYSEVEGMATVRPEDVVVVKITPAKPSLKGTLYFFFNNTGKFTLDHSYSYAVNDAKTLTPITDTASPSTITAPAGTKTIQLNQTGFIKPQWTGGNANISIDATGKISGLDNPAEAGKTVTFTLTDAVDPTNTHAFNIKIPAKDTPDNGGNHSDKGGTTTIIVSNGSTTQGSQTNQAPSTTPDVSTASANQSDQASNTSSVSVPSSTSKKGTAVYATKTIYMYKNATFKKNQRLVKYPKQKRVNRPMFVITDYARSKGGALRYKVKDVNHHSKSAGKIGYITANPNYVSSVYYQSVPKNKKITVIAKKGVHAYKNQSLTGRTKSYKKGAHLTVKKVVKHNLTTRYQLNNGYYVSASKKLVIQEN